MFPRKNDSASLGIAANAKRYQDFAELETCSDAGPGEEPIAFRAPDEHHNPFRRSANVVQTPARPVVTGRERHSKSPAESTGRDARVRIRRITISGSEERPGSSPGGATRL
jgi:hypothetical protein